VRRWGGGGAQAQAEWSEGAALRAVLGYTYAELCFERLRELGEIPPERAEQLSVQLRMVRAPSRPNSGNVHACTASAMWQGVACVSPALLTTPESVECRLSVG
jgi:hypothetical protein